MTEGTRAGGTPARGGRAVAALLLVVLAGVLAPVAAVAAWTQALVADTDVFVATYGPVVRSPAVQALVTVRLTDAVVEQVGLGDNPLLRNAVRRVVGDLASSDAYATAATASLRIAHSELLALLSGAPGSLDVADGEVKLRLAPFAEAVASRLSEAGVPFVDRLPPVTGGIPLLRVDPALVPAIRTAYGAIRIVAGWLPWLALGLGLCGVLLHPRTRHAFMGLGLAVLGGVAAVSVAWQSLAQAATAGVAADLAAVIEQVLSASATPLVPTFLALGVAGTLLAALAWLAVPAHPDKPARE